MHILLLSQWYTPEPGFKTDVLAKDLVSRGHTVTTITGFPNYPTGKLYRGYQIRWRQWELHDGVRVLRLPLYPNHSHSAIKRVLNYFSFAASATLLGSALCGPAEVMWVYHPPLTVGIPAWWIGLLRRIPFIYNIHDMWPETLAATGMMPSPLVQRALGQLAGWVYNQAAALTVVTPGFKTNLIAKGVPADKIHVIPNWADEDIYRPVPQNSVLAQTIGAKDRFNIIYAGNIGLAQGLDTILDTAQLLQDIPEIQFVLIGGGVDREHLQVRAQKMHLTNVRFVDQQPPERMADFLALADVLYMQLRDEPLFRITIPSKMYSYLACARPIIAAVTGDAADTIQEAQAGLVCLPQDPAALAKAVRTLYAMPKHEREAMGEAGRRTFEMRYTRRTLMDCYETLLKEVAGCSRR